MRILICHGYLLRGTGSNQYVQSLTRALCKQGHRVLVMCQESDPTLDFVSSYLREESQDSGAQVVWQQDTPYEGTCMVYQPDIGGLLPVYVADSYPGFTVKEFTALDENELGRYVDRNRRALERLVEQFAPAAILVNHAVMLPFITRPVAGRAGVPYCVCIHGSAIEYTVRKDPRYLPYGAEGLSGARRIFVPSEHTARQVIEVFGDLVEDLGRALAPLPPGVDTDLFAPAGDDLEGSTDALLAAIEARTRGVTVGDFGRRSGTAGAAAGAGEPDISAEVEAINAQHPDWLPDADLDARLDAFARAGGPFLMYLGKLLETKGVQCVLPALPLVMDREPAARLVVVGFGELRGILELMVDALDAGDMPALRELCEFGNERCELCAGSFDHVLEFIRDMEERGELRGYARRCREAGVRGAVLFTGYLTPEEHRHLLGHATALLVPSLAQEAFGLVATEAMAAGVLPIASNHSGLEAAMAPVREVWGAEAAPFLLDTGGRLVESIARACADVLARPLPELREKGGRMREVVRRRFSWDAQAALLASEMREGAGGVRDPA